MVRIKYIALLSAVLLSFASQAQIYLNEVREPILCFGLVVEDSTFVLNGTVIRPDTVCGGGVHRDRMYTRIDFQGNVVDTLRINNDYCGGTSQTDPINRWNDSTYYQVGWVGDYPNGSDVSAELQIIKSDLTDTIARIRFQQDTSKGTAWYYSDLDDLNRLVGLGLITDTTDTVGFYIPYVFRVDENYGVTSLALFPKTTTTIEAGLFPTSVTCGPMGQIAIGVQDYWNFDENDYNGWVIVMDSTGQELWRHRMWTQPDRYDCGPEVFAISDGNYIVAQQRAYEDASSEPIYTNENRIAVKKIDPQGSVIWSKEFGNSIEIIPGQPDPIFEPHFRPYVIKENQTGEIFIGGTNFNWSAILKLSSNGDSLWYREVRDREGNYSSNILNSAKEVNYLYDMELLGDTAILVAGQYQTDAGGAVYPNGAQRNWFALLDQYGCDSVGCQYVNIIEPQNPLHELTIYPNPVKDILRVTGAQTEEYEVFDLMGRTVLRGFLNEGIDVSELPAGVYVLRIGNESRRFVTYD